MEKISIAFFKGGDNLFHKIVRWWTKSPYSHAELIMPTGEWISISPFLAKQVESRTGPDAPMSQWDFIEIEVNEKKIESLERFYELTKGQKYDWFGMIASQILPFHIKGRSRWYCSEWIAYALRISGILKWDRIQIYDQSDLSPQKLYELVSTRE